MTHIGTFISDARQKGMSDETIREALLAEGWDKAVVALELAGLEVPKPDTVELHHNDRHTHKPHHEAEQPAHKPASLSPLMAALHHVLLWFFTGSSTVTIAAVVASLFGTNVSSNALTSMIAVTLVTFTPYAALFIMYVLKLRRTPGLVPSKVWSIITVCFHSVAAMIAAITLIVGLINNGDGSLIISAALILTLDAIVVATYAMLGFTGSHSRLRRIAALLYVPLLVILFGTLTIMSVLRLGPAKHDEQLRKDLAAAVQDINGYTKANATLPSTGGDVGMPSGIDYTKTGDATYEVCANFQTNTGGAYYTPTSTASDDYVSDYQFMTPSGYQCFNFESYELRLKMMRDL